jgi:hypothetical protein
LAASNVPVKTPDGVAEMNSRQRKLSQRHRTVLLLVDGRRTEAEIRQMAAAAGAPANCFDDLLQQGLITRPALQDLGIPVTMPSDGGVDLPLPIDAEASVPPSPDSVTSSLLPASRTLAPDSNLEYRPTGHGELTRPAELGESAPVPLDMPDPSLEEARAILLRAVRAEAPVAGSLTMMRLRRARTRGDVEGLLDEVESKIFKPFKGLWASQTMARVRELLSTPPPL